MRDYEVVYIFEGALDEDAVNARLEEFHKPLTAPEGSEITAVDHWGVRQLAYPIGGRKTGYYVVVHFRSEPSALPELERLVHLSDDVVRHLLVVSEGEPISGRSVVAEGPVGPSGEADDEDDRDEEDEDEGEAGPEEEGAAEGRGAASPPEFSGGQGRRRRVDGPRIELLNYKDVQTLSRFITEQGKILPRRTTKVTARFQRQLGRAVKRARHLALLPYVQDHEG